MQQPNASKFKVRCRSLLDLLDPEGFVTTKHGKPVARLIPTESGCASLIGSMKGKVKIERCFLHGNRLGCSILTLPAGNPLGISAIVLGEVEKLAQLGRVAINVKSSEFTRIFARVHVWPLDLAICRKSTELDYRSVVHRAPLLTRDPKTREVEGRADCPPLSRLNRFRCE